MLHKNTYTNILDFGSILNVAMVVGKSFWPAFHPHLLSLQTVIIEPLALASLGCRFLDIPLRRLTP